MIQPGAFGDILLCAPIAHHYYLLGYDVIWPARQKFKALIEDLHYIHYMELDERELHEDWLRSDVMKSLEIQNIYKFNRVLNLADRGPHSTAQLSTENFEQCKYRLAQRDFELKNNLSFYNNGKFKLLEEKLNLPPKYVFVHNSDSYNQEVEIPPQDLPIVKCQEIPGFTILDWYEVIKAASKIYCVESAVHQFIDGIIHLLDTKPILLPRKILQPNTRFTISKYWDKSIIGEDSKVIG
jgi:hypothetical protein